MEQSELLRFVVGVMDQLGIRYFVTGSVATVYYGEPRFTIDIDIVADLPIEKAREFCRLFPTSAYYLSEEAVRQAIGSHGQFNIIHPAFGLKADIIIPPNTAYDHGRFIRAKRVVHERNTEVVITSPEDAIIKKMASYLEGGSEKHLRDIAGVLKISGAAVDREFIADWASKLGLTEIWNAILARQG